MKSDTEAELDVASAIDVETELAEAAVEAAGLPDGGVCKFELIAAAVLEAGLAVDGADAADDAAEDAAKTTAEVATEIAAEVAPEVAAEVTVEASGGNLSFKLVGYAVPEERETELAEAAVEAAGLPDGFAVEAEDIGEVATEVTVEAAGGILACVLSASLKLAYSLVLISAIAVDKVSVVGAEAAVEVSDVLTRVRNLSFKLVGYAVAGERETELAEAAEDPAGMLDCELGTSELIAAAVLEARFAVDTEDTAEDAAKVATEVAPEAAEILACVLSASFEIEDPIKIIGEVSVETDSVIDAEATEETSGVLTRVGNLSFKLVRYAVPE
ncbi:hypothetical protein E4U14_007959 [Claviceps sp. LM454 group G7]|nr:hypothetical protein E4U14_007959 [Claviceps sp. LM454 group G7]